MMRSMIPGNWKSLTLQTPPLQSIADQCCRLSDSIRWACVLEATAPKAGNVHPGRAFDDLNYEHFVQAADVTSEHLTRFDQSTGKRIFDCVRACKTVTGTNVNLGIVLLIAPLVESVHSGHSIHEVLSGLDETDAEKIFAAIRIAGAGGLGNVDQMDVQVPADAIDIVAAMRLAADRDRIAVQYAEGFTDLFSNVVPVISKSIVHFGDVLSGICDAHLRLLVASPDSLIARKCGLTVAKQVQHRAGEVDLSDPLSKMRFDDWLRRDGHRLNPGTTADLIAAALLILLIPKTEP